MQPPTAVPTNGPPSTVAVVTRPEGAKVTLTGIEVRTSSADRHDAARRLATEMATAAAGRLMSTLATGGAAAGGGITS